MPNQSKVYCRWSEGSDLYVHWDGYLYTISVACYRYAYLPGLPQIVHIPRIPIGGEKINLSWDGHSFYFEQLDQMAEKLLELKSLGYLIPDGVFKQISHDLRGESEWGE